MIERWVLGAAVIIAVVLITASVLRPEETNLKFSAVGGLGAIAVACFVFGRS